MINNGSCDKFVNFGRHAAECKICAHAQREEIERDFINWRSPASIAKLYKLKNRTSVYRHAHALGLYSYPNGLEEGRSRARHGE
jgi:hypothetical protein